jgi:membrane peptidoglycan carboxypeptidase
VPSDPRTFDVLDLARVRGRIGLSLIVPIALSLVLGAGLLGGLVGGTRWLKAASVGLPDPSIVETIDQVRTLRIVGADRTTLFATRTFDEDRDTLAYDNFPRLFLDATVAVEDRTFWENTGIDPKAILRAALANSDAGEIVQGGSTITQQLVKLLIGDRELTLTRKAREALFAYRLSGEMSKRDILALYLNSVYYGQNAYGAAAAARRYFGKPIAALNDGQLTLLVGLPQSPTEHNPLLNPEDARRRQEAVLTAMIRAGVVDLPRAQQILAEPWEIDPQTPPPDRYPWLSTAVLDEAIAIFAAAGEEDPQRALATCGCTIVTTIDAALQERSLELLRTQIATLRRPYNVHNAAAVAMDPRTGDVRLYLGSLDPGANTARLRGAYDHAGTALRSPGSSWKPIVYLSAMERAGIHAATPLFDVPTDFGAGYRPQNAVLPSYKGMVTLRNALRDSRNVPAVRAMMAYASIEGMIEMAERLGIEPGHLVRSRLGAAAAIGVEGVTVLEMARVYSTIAAAGQRPTPRFITQIVRSDGTAVYDAPREGDGRNTLDPRLAFSMIDMLRDNADPKKGWLAGKRANLKRPAFVKTGTGSDVRDTYAVGGVPQLVTAVWFGNSDFTSMGIGSWGGPLLAWQSIMAEAVKTLPVEDWGVPAGMTAIDFCADDRYNGYGGTGLPIAEDRHCPYGTATEWIRDEWVARVSTPRYVPVRFVGCSVSLRAELSAWQDDLARGRGYVRTPLPASCARAPEPSADLTPSLDPSTAPIIDPSLPPQP